MTDRAPYSRVYWSIVDDPKFARVFDDDRKLATWLRLLIVADQAHPASAYVPLGTNRTALTALSDCGLIDIGAGNRYRIHGLDKERARRRPASAPEPDRDGSGTGPAPDPSSLGVQGLSKAEQSKDETSRDAPSSARAPDPADVYWTLTGRYPTDKVLGWVDDLSASYGPEAVIRALATTHGQDASTNTLLGRTQDVLRAEARALDIKAQATERSRLQEKRSAPRQVVDQEAVQAEVQRILRGEAA